MRAPSECAARRVVERPAREVHKDQRVSVRRSELANREEGRKLLQQPRRRGDVADSDPGYLTPAQPEHGHEPHHRAVVSEPSSDRRQLISV